MCRSTWQNIAYAGFAVALERGGVWDKLVRMKTLQFRQNMELYCLALQFRPQVSTPCMTCGHEGPKVWVMGRIEGH